MLDIKFVRENIGVVKKNLEKRRDPAIIKLLEDVLKKDEHWRKLKIKVDSLKQKRNEISLEISKLKKEKKDASAKIKEAADIPKEIAQIEFEMGELEKQIRDGLMRTPNMLHDSVPYGKDDTENVEITTFGKKPKFDFEPKSHVDLVELHDWVDLTRAAKISGARWYFLKGELALLEMAIVKYAVDFMSKRGYTLVVPPFMMNRKAYEGVTSMADFEDVLYKIEGEDLYAIATSEHPNTAMYMDEVFDEKQLPIKMIGYSTNFRKEAGAHGKDMKGIFRVHQFNKVEQLIICKPEDSWKFHEELLQNGKDFFESLGISCHVINICTGDIGIVAAKKYDIEAWMPVQNTYREVVSCSNCTSYQAVRLNMRYQKGEKREHVHTLNSTCVATSRALVAIMENFQQKDGSVKVPDVLVPYMNGVKVIRKKR